MAVKKAKKSSIGFEKVGENVYLFEAKAPSKPNLATFTRNGSYNIINFGSKNNYPQELVRLINNSPTAQACTKSHAKYIAGDGFIFDSENLFNQNLAKILNTDLLQRISYDYAYFETICLHLKFDLNGKIVNIEPTDVSTVRLGEPDTATGEITYAKLSSDWENITGRDSQINKPVQIDLYHPLKIKERIASFNNNVEEFTKWNGALVYAKRYRPAQPVYITPSWASSQDWVYTDGEIQTFHANNIDNAFMPSVLIFVPFELKGTDAATGKPKKEAFKDHLKDTLTGSKKAGEVAVISGTNKDAMPQITQFNANSNHELFIALSELITKHVTRAFQIPQILAGIETSGKLGSSNEIANSVELYYNTVIKDDVNFITEVLNGLIKEMPMWVNEKVTISNPKPFNWIDPVFKEMFTEGEIRLSAGYPEKKPVGEGGINE